jgi:hypothetical protein
VNFRSEKCAEVRKKAASKALFYVSTSKSPRGDFLIYRYLQFPPWGVGGKTDAFETASLLFHEGLVVILSEVSPYR